MGNVLVTLGCLLVLRGGERVFAADVTLRSLLGVTQETAASGAEDGDLGRMAGKSIPIDLPGLPSGAKKLELALLLVFAYEQA